VDDFLEQVVTRRRRGASDALFYACWFSLSALALAGAVGLAGMLYATEDGSMAVNWLAVARGAVPLALAFLLWKVSDRLRIEYDYSFTNGVIDVARVMNRRRRAPLAALEMRDVRAAGEVGSAKYNSAARAPGTKIHKWYLNADAKLYFFAFERKGARHLMILELNSDMAALIFSRKYMPAGAWDGAYSDI
jgi:hypothetical protein